MGLMAERTTPTVIPPQHRPRGNVIARPSHVTRAILAVMSLMVIFSRHLVDSFRQTCRARRNLPPVPGPGALSDASLDIIRRLDVLQIRATGTLEDQPIDWYYRVDCDGQVALGPSYGRVNVMGLTWEQAESKIKEHLKKVVRDPEVQVTLAKREASPHSDELSRTPYRIAAWDILLIEAVGAISGSPLDGYYLVEPSGQLPLGVAYGRVEVSGLTCEQAERKIADYLKNIVTDDELRSMIQAATAAKDDWQETEKLHEFDKHVVSQAAVQKRYQSWKEKERLVEEARQRSRVSPKVQVTAARRGGPWREAVLPKTPYKTGPWDVLHVWVLGTLIDQPIDGSFSVESTGTLALGPVYGRVRVTGFTLEEAEEAIGMQLKQFLAHPEVQVALVQQANQAKQWRETSPPRAPYAIRPGMLLLISVSGTSPDVPINGVFTVEPTGTVALGPVYARAQVNGLTLEAPKR